MGGELCVTYRIHLDNWTEKEFAVKLDPDTLSLIQQVPPAPAPWAALGNRKCKSCTLDESANPYCPVAVNLQELMEFLKDMVSYDEADVTVETNERRYFKRTTFQTTASSIMGIIMVTSGCPVLDRMRPMVETHLPFSTLDETIYRFVTMYLFGQYFIYKKGGVPDWDMERLVEFFETVEEVNTSFCRRLDTMRNEDSSVNGVSILSCMSTMTKFAITDNDMEHWEKIYLAYYGAAPGGGLNHIDLPPAAI